jgi:hypothetical protein
MQNHLVTVALLAAHNCHIANIVRLLVDLCYGKCGVVFGSWRMAEVVLFGWRFYACRCFVGESA